MAFALGWRARPERVGLSRPAVPTAVVNADHPASGDLKAPVSPPPRIADQGPDEVDARKAIPPASVVGRLRVVQAENAHAVPVVARPRIDGPSINNPMRITEHQLALLEQQGYQVDRHRRLVTATLVDGRRVTVPVDHIQVRYTGTEPL
jgi:hypothetical protein